MDNLQHLSGHRYNSDQLVIICNMKKIQVLAVAVHPDDVELCCSGTLMMEKMHGKTIGVVDLTRGELGTRGTPELRLRRKLQLRQDHGSGYPGKPGYGRWVFSE